MARSMTKGVRTVRCVVLGATGYVGGRLVPELLAAGHSLRVVARSPEKLADAPWRSDVEVVRADVLDQAAVTEALRGQEIVYYLVHSLTRRDYANIDRRAAHVVGEAAAAAGVRRIVYLGGPVPNAAHVSAHLASRAEVGRELARHGVPTISFQAAIIIGSGSASFEMLRYLTERLPLMVTPKWVTNRVQPIAIRDVLYYLVRAADLPRTAAGAFDIGGPEVLTYRDMMRRYAAVAGLPSRVIVATRLLSPWLSAQWVNLVTPVPRAIAVPLIESLVNDAVCQDQSVKALIPDPPDGFVTYETAVELALARITRGEVPTRWSDASAPSDALPSDPAWAGGSLHQDFRTRATDLPPGAVWQVIESIGGEQGWYSFPLAWSVRGWADRVIGGAGLRRGRRDPHRLRAGDALDWWRVETLERGRLLRLRAEMKIPGRAWLELAVDPSADGGSLYSQRALFEPRGLSGQLYWKVTSPFHAVIFGGMLRNVVAAGRRNECAPAP